MSARTARSPTTAASASTWWRRCEQIDIPNLRWPGGCFADEYHWKDGIGPKRRPALDGQHATGATSRRTTTSAPTSSWHLCELLGAEPYITGNVGSGIVQEMSQWVEYLTRDSDSPMARLRRDNGREEPWQVKFWGIGNETWGCGGNMRAEYYADLARRYGTYCRDHGEQQAVPHRLRAARRRLRVDRGADEDHRRPRLRMPPAEPLPGDLPAPLQLRPAAGMGLHGPPWRERQRNRTSTLTTTTRR